MAEPRSYLYVPGDQLGLLDKALSFGPDALIVDLEDAVHPSYKEVARDTAKNWLLALPPTTAEIWVRTNSGDARLLETSFFAGCTNLTGLCLAKVESPGEVADVAALLEAASSQLQIMPLLESAAAVLDARAIAQAPRVRRLQIGEADLSVDVGASPTQTGPELSFARSWVVFASAAAGIASPIAAVSPDFRDLTTFAETTESMRRLGFFGRACIHPAQVAVANDSFRISPADAERAQALLDHHAEAGVGVFVGPDGTMVDEALLRAARRTVSQARS